MPEEQPEEESVEKPQEPQQEKETEQQEQNEEKQESEEKASLAGALSNQINDSSAGTEAKAIDKKEADQPLTLASKKNWFYVGLIIAVLNPIFAGLIMGVFFSTEENLKKEGRIVLLVAIIFGFIHTYAVLKIMPYFIQQGLM